MSVKFKLSDLPPHLIARIHPADRAALGLDPPESATPPPEDAAPSAPQPRQPKGPNKTEQRYRNEILRHQDARYEALTFRLANGHRYTPDWVIIENGAITQCHEVKGSYRHHSWHRARLAFDQARLEYPAIRWVWAQWKEGTWHTS